MGVTINKEFYEQKFRKGKRPGDTDNNNRKYLDFSLEGLKQPNIELTDITQVIERCALYFSRCSEEGLRPGIAGMCVWLGINRQRWEKWVSGKEFKTTHYISCNKINALFEAQMESYMQNGEINPVSAIFLLKSQHGYTDTPEPKTETKESVIQEKNMIDILKLAEHNKK